MGAYDVFPDKRSVIVADRGCSDSKLRNDWDSNDSEARIAIFESAFSSQLDDGCIGSIFTDIAITYDRPHGLTE